MKNKNFAKIIVVFLLFFSLFVLASCDNTSTESHPEISQQTSKEETSETSTETSEQNPITVETEVKVFVGDTYQLEPQQNGVSASEFSYNTSNVNIATVTKKGEIKGKQDANVLSNGMGGIIGIIVDNSWFAFIGKNEVGLGDNKYLGKIIDSINIYYPGIDRTKNYIECCYDINQ